MEATQRVLITISPTFIYQQLKEWDNIRAKQLKQHYFVVKEVLRNLDEKVKQSQNYILEMHQLLKSRVLQIEQYCKAGINETSMVLGGSYLSSFKSQFNLLKSIMNEESERELQLTNRNILLKIQLEKLNKIKEQQCIDGIKVLTGWESNSVSVLKSTLRELMECHLQDINDAVEAAAAEVSLANQNTNQKDLFCSIMQFINLAKKQLHIHNQTGKQLLSTVDAYVTREKKLKKQLRSILLKWVEIDIGKESPYCQQLSKKNNQFLIDEYYDIEEMTSSKKNVKEYLTTLKFTPFQKHKQLMLFNRKAMLSNENVNIVFTEPSFLNIFNQEMKVLHCLKLSHQTILRKQKLNLRITSQNKVYFVMTSVEFDVCLAFDTEDAIDEFIQVIKKISNSVTQHVIKVSQ